MKLEMLSEIVWNYYDGGRPTATNQTLEQDDIRGMVLMQLAEQLKMRFYESRKDPDGDKTVFISGLLSTKRYKIGDTDARGKRVAICKDEVLRLPKGYDKTSVYMVSDGCTGIVDGLLPPVQPGEENFYINDVSMRNYTFHVEKKEKIETYNVPPCVKEIEVERIFATDDLDVPADVAFDVATQVLGISLKVRGFIPTADNSMDGNRDQLRRQLEQSNAKM
jgi:hypothetical protein